MAAVKTETDINLCPQPSTEEDMLFQSVDYFNKRDHSSFVTDEINSPIPTRNERPTGGSGVLVYGPSWRCYHGNGGNENKDWMILSKSTRAIVVL